MPPNNGNKGNGGPPPPLGAGPPATGPLGPDNQPLKTQPGVPTHGDAGQATADEAAKAEALRRLVQGDLNNPDRDEALRTHDPYGEDERFAHRGMDRGDGFSARPTNEDQYDGRDEDLDLARGGSERQFSDSDWQRSMMRIDPERRRMLQDRWRNAVLPDLPKKAGMRRFWASTTHVYHTPQFWVGMGYRFVKYEDLHHEGWNADQYAVKDAQNIFAGCVMWREMIAMETSERNWYAIMRESHHDAPYEMARGIYEQLDQAGEQVRHAGGRTSMSPGMEQLKVHTRPPRQFQ
jgi:hypothetical protein